MVSRCWRRRAAGILLLAALGCTRQPAGLVASGVDDEVSGRDARVNEVFCFGFWKLAAQGSAEVRLTDVELMDAPEWGTDLNRDRLDPLTALTLTPGRPLHRQVLICVRGTALGTFETRGLRVHYTVDGREAAEEYNHRLRLGVTRP